MAATAAPATGEGAQAQDARDNDTNDLLTSDGDLRQIEKADINAARANDGHPVPVPLDPTFNEVVALGKDGSGAPEEDEADISDFSPAGDRASQAQPPPV